MAQITIENLSFSYPKAKNAAISKVSLKIGQGTFVVLCGKSGCGKSTLLRNIKPAICPFGKKEGQVFWNGEKIEAVDEKLQARKIGFVMQSPEHQLVTDKVWHELAFGMENLGYPQHEIQMRVAEISEYFGITDWYEQKVDLLSGGQKQLLNLAATMVLNPEILILDEPTAQLDPIAAEHFLDTLKKINEDFGITIILSEHRLNYVLPMADQAIIMEQGQVIHQGAVSEVLMKNLDNEFMKLMPYPAQIYYEATKDGKGPMPISVRQGREWMEAGKRAGVVEEASLEETKQSVVSCKNVWFRYEREGRDILRGLTTQINGGEIFAILGGNGTGKTTTLSVLSGLYRPYRGKIQITGNVTYLPQDVQTLFCRDTVEKELEGVPEELVKFMELQEYLKHHPYDLSGGQQQKLGLAKVLATDPDILLLDEPTKGIDGIYKEQLGKILVELKQQGKTIIIVSHDIDFCGEYADRCGLFSRGNIVSAGPVRSFFAGNRFYTTTVNKMAGKVLKGAVKKEDVLCFLTEDNTISSPL
ncbi:MAG: ATP-binding cassette domain-containing protein [Eubacterium sp.]|nr:ATP-binding cassette domain-containing protein [Eubacterium sp.]